MTTLPYASVGKRRTSETPAVVLAEFSFDPSGPFSQWGRECLDREDGQPAPKGVEGYTMLALEREGVTFLVATKKEADRSGREALQLIASSFAARIGMARARGATRRYAFNAEFAPPIQRHLEKFAKRGEVDEDLAELQSDLENVKGKMQGSIAAMIDRGKTMGEVAAASDVMSQQADAFSRAASKLKRAHVWEQVKMKVMIILAFAVIFLLLYLILFRA